MSIDTSDPEYRALKLIRELNLEWSLELHERLAAWWREAYREGCLEQRRGADSGTQRGEHSQGTLEASLSPTEDIADYRQVGGQPPCVPLSAFLPAYQGVLSQSDRPTDRPNPLREIP